MRVVGVDAEEASKGYWGELWTAKSGIGLGHVICI